MIPQARRNGADEKETVRDRESETWRFRKELTCPNRRHSQEQRHDVQPIGEPLRRSLNAAAVIPLRVVVGGEFNQIRRRRRLKLRSRISRSHKKSSVKFQRTKRREPE